MNKIKRKFWLSMLGFIIVLVAVLIVNFINEERKQNLFENRKDFVTNLSLPSNEQIEKKIEDLNIKVTKAERYIFEGGNPLFFIETIEGLAKDLGVDILIQNAESQEKEDGTGGEIKMIASIEGSLVELEKFLAQLENLEKEVSVSSMEFSRIQREEESFWRGIFSIVASTK